MIKFVIRPRLFLLVSYQSETVTFKGVIRPHLFCLVSSQVRDSYFSIYNKKLHSRCTSKTIL